MANFGLAWSCVSGLTMPSIMVTGFRVVAEAIARRWQTPNGTLINDSTYGYDLSQFIGNDLDPATIGRIGLAAAAEAEKDQRVRSCFATISLIDNVMLVNARVETAQGPFSMVVSVSQLSLTLLQVKAAA